jgi:hypothetical protein
MRNWSHRPSAAGRPGMLRDGLNARDIPVASVGHGEACRFVQAPLIAATDRLQVRNIAPSNAARAGQTVAHYPAARVVSNVEELRMSDRSGARRRRHGTNRMCRSPQLRSSAPRRRGAGGRSRRLRRRPRSTGAPRDPVASLKIGPHAWHSSRVAAVATSSGCRDPTRSDERQGALLVDRNRKVHHCAG